VARVTIEEARALCRASPVVDAHCDTLLKLGDGPGRGLGVARDDTHIDLPRLEGAGVAAQFFACYVETEPGARRALGRALQLIEAFHREVADSRGRLMAVTGVAGVWDAFHRGKVAGLLTLEGGAALQGYLSALKAFYRLGVRGVTLTWNFRNELADGVLETRTGGGLTRFGVEVVEEMGRLGMLVDVSHLSEAGFWQVLELARGPVVATHSNARAVCDHPRNLSDEQIKALAAKGGVMGLNAAPGFVRKTSGFSDSDARNEGATLGDLLDHAEHVIGLAGVDCLGLGLDFDGISSTPDGLEDVSRLPNLVLGLLERGHGPKTVTSLLGGNFLRVMKEVGMD
jgi:membrane dipeptidase